jgi:hypothetical protein
MMDDIEIYLVIQSDRSLGCRPLPAIVIPVELRPAEAVLIEVLRDRLQVDACGQMVTGEVPLEDRHAHRSCEQPHFVAAGGSQQGAESDFTLGAMVGLA